MPGLKGTLALLLLLLPPYLLSAGEEAASAGSSNMDMAPALRDELGGPPRAEGLPSAVVVVIAPPFEWPFLPSDMTPVPSPS